METASSTLKSIDYSLKKNFYQCTTDEDGGKLKLPLCILTFPAIAVLSPKPLKIAVIEETKEDGRIQVTPAIHCTDLDWCAAVQFHKPITIEVQTTTNWTGEDIEIQVTESSRTMNWQKVYGVKVTRKTDSISFSLSSFAGPPCTIKASLSIPTMSASLSEVRFEIRVNCFKIHENQMIKIAKGDCSAVIQPGVPVDIEYKVWSSGSSCSKLYAFYWNAPAIPRSLSISSVNHLVVNANGDQSIGLHVSPEALPMLTDGVRRLCESERGFRDRELPPLLRDNSVPRDSESASLSYPSLSMISALDHSNAVLDDSGIGLFGNLQLTPFPSPVIGGQVLFNDEGLDGSLTSIS